MWQIVLHNHFCTRTLDSSPNIYLDQAVLIGTEFRYAMFHMTWALEFVSHRLNHVFLYTVQVCCSRTNLFFILTVQASSIPKLFRQNHWELNHDHPEPFSHRLTQISFTQISGGPSILHDHVGRYLLLGILGVGWQIDASHATWTVDPISPNPD